jgi:hypothetical protein
LKILGGKNDETRTSVNGKVVWQMEEMENAFRFFIVGSPEQELFVEHDELIAAGTAYSEQPPLSILDILEKLEKLAPEFHGVNVSDDVMLIRKRLALSKGLILTNGDENRLFLKDETLVTINFLDFRQEYITQTSEENGKIHL